MRTFCCGVLLLFVAGTTGCTTGGGIVYQAQPSPSAAPLGATAVLVRRPVSVDPMMVPNDLIRARVAAVLAAQAGAVDVTLAAVDETFPESMSDYQLVVAAKAAHIDTLCIITVVNMSGRFAISLQIV